MDREIPFSSPAEDLDNSDSEVKNRSTGMFRNKIIALMALLSLSGGCATASSFEKASASGNTDSGLVKKDRPAAAPAVPDDTGCAEDHPKKKPAKKKPANNEKNEEEQRPAEQREERYEDEPFSTERCLWWDRCFIVDSGDSFPADKA